MTPVGIAWLIAVIFAVLIFVLTTIWIVRKGLNLYRGIRDIEFPQAEGGEKSPSPARKPAPTGDPATLTAARVSRHTVKQQRRANKERRLARAQDRWAEYDLVSERDWEPQSTL